RQPRRIAAGEWMMHETALYPRYALLEGHRSFTRLPRLGQHPFTPRNREPSSFPSPIELFRQMGVRDWFARLQPRETSEYSKRYCVKKDALSLPTFSLQVADVRPAGTRAVFDLAVNDLHAFVAGTAIVHNCIGNSGPLKPEISAAVKAGDLTACAVLSGNRNFEGRVHPEVRMNFLASPPLVVAYALAGTLDIRQEPPVLRRHEHDTARARGRARRPRARAARRLGHHRSYLPRRQHRPQQPGGALSRRARRGTKGLQLLRRAPRQSRGHDA